MANIVASGQITLVDLNDAKSLSAYINSNQPKIQIVNGDTGARTPDWASSNVVLTPELYVTGTQTNIITNAKSITWYEGGSATPIATGNGYTVGASNPKSLTISQNKLTEGSPQLTYICEIVWTDTVFNSDISVKTEIEFARVSSGASGAAGAGAVTGVLSNETHTIPTLADGSGGNFSGATTTLSVFVGATDTTSSWTYTATPSSGVTGTASGTPANRTYTVTGMTVDAGYIDFTASRSGYAPVTKRFTIVKSKQGQSGTTPTSYWLTNTASAIAKSITGIYSPGSLTFNGMSQTGTGTPGAYSGKFMIAELQSDGTTWTDKYTSAGPESSKAWTPSANIKAIRARLYVASATPGASNFIDEQVISVVSDGATGQTGASAVTGVLSNDAHTVATDSAGNGGSFTNAVTTMMVYVGATDDSANWTVTAGTPVGLTGSLSGKTYTVTAMSADTAYVDLTAAKSGYSSVTKRFSLSKNKQGTAGQTPTTYWMATSAGAIGKNIAGAFSPTSITATGFSQTGTATPASTAIYKFRIDTDTGSGFVNGTADASAVASKTTSTFPANLKALRFRMYQSSVTPSDTNFIDEQIVPVVADGATGQTGQNSVIAYVWAPNGNIVKNGSGSVQAKCDVYDGMSVATGTAYKWYKLVSGSYVQLTAGTNYGCTGYTTATLTIPAGAVESMSSFKCTVTYGGNDFSDVVTIVDQSDPIQVTLVSAEGNVFRNGVGNKNVTAKVYQGGTEIDVAGTTYEYRWYLRDQDGNANNDSTFVDSGKTYKTGKTILVKDTHVTNIGNLILELWTK